jgi:uncharacterized protein (DUF1697 family)
LQNDAEASQNKVAGWNVRPFSNCSEWRLDKRCELKAIRQSAVAEINARATVENAFMLEDESVIDFSDGISASKLTLDFRERCASSTGTDRNWNTVVKLLDVAVAMG